MQVLLEKQQEEGRTPSPDMSNIEMLNELQLALVGGGSVTVIIG